jgi:hypothetical protein
MFNCKSNLILSFHNSSDKINIRKTIRPCKCNRPIYFIPTWMYIPKMWIKYIARKWKINF